MQGDQGKTVLPEEKQQLAPDEFSQQEQDTPKYLPPHQALTLCDLSPDQIEPNPFQARKMFSEVALNELAESIKSYGVLARIRVRPHPLKPGIYQLVYGERRLRATKLAQLASIPCEVVVYSDEELQEIGLIENLQRQDLHPLEEAEMFQQLLSQKEHAYSYRSLAERLGKNKSYVEDRMALVHLPEDVLQLLKEVPGVSLRALGEIGKIPQPEAREPLLQQLRTGRMSTEDVRAIVREVLEQLSTASSSDKEPANVLVFDRLFYKAKRRMDSALAQLKEAVTLYSAAPDAKKKEALAQYLQSFQREAKQVEDMLQ